MNWYVVCYGRIYKMDFDTVCKVLRCLGNGTSFLLPDLGEDVTTQGLHGCIIDVSTMSRSDAKQQYQLLRVRRSSHPRFKTNVLGSNIADHIPPTA